MTMSMRVMSAGKGVRYLLSSVVVGDGIRDAASSLTRYYAEKGTPPGFWVGGGVDSLGDGEIRAGDVVTANQLELLIGRACDPVSGEPLGRPLPIYRSVDERIEHAIKALPASLTTTERADAVAAIETAERRRGASSAVAGFDHTFSVPKSVSVLWAVADGGTQALIARAHHAALAEVLALLEQRVATTRMGADAGGGSVVFADVRGVVATAYDHYDSRAADPQLHTHVVIANRVRSVVDGKWRTLDSRMIHAAVVALSEHYNGVLADHLARDLGLEWQHRERGDERNDAFELTAVPQVLIEEFSSRAHDIEHEKNRLIAEYQAKHPGRVSKRTVLRLRAEATIRTRPEKTVQSLADLTSQWRGRASRLLREDATTWARAVLAEGGRPALLRADDLPLDVLTALGAATVEEVGQQRTTWRRWNLHAEASRQIMQLRFASTADRERVLDLVVDAAERASVRLTPPELAHIPAQFRRADGGSMFRPLQSVHFTSQTMLAAEDRLLVLAADTSAATLELGTVEWVARRPLSDGSVLSPDQAHAVTSIALSGRRVDVLIGPAGAGKTSTLSVLRRAWEQEHGRASVIGLAPTAKAAEVLADELGIITENTAKWAERHEAGKWDFRRDQLVIIDEASTAGTFALDALTAHAAAVGAKVLLVGDPAQLDAVESSGAFGLIAETIEDRPELTEVWRFRNEWEKHASLALRLGELQALDAYAEHDRIRGGGHEAMLDATYRAWRGDVADDRTSLMIAETVEATTALNLRARVDRIADGTVDPRHPIVLRDGTEASAGDIVVTRRNERRIRTGRGWVKNGDLWNVVSTHADGSLTIRRLAGGNGTIRLPANYATADLELAYAVTAYRAQGSTVDAAHAFVGSPSMTRESLYVAMTRGRLANHVYVATDQAVLEEHQRRPDELDARDVLAGVLHHRGAERSAHEVTRDEQETWTSVAQLAAEYDTIAQTAQRARWLECLRRAGLEPGQLDQVADEESFGPLAAELRRAEANSLDPERLLRVAIAEREITDADDIAAVIRYRIQRVTLPRSGGTRGVRAPKLIVGLIPVATGVDDDELRRALDERAQLIEQRASALVDAALERPPAWLRDLGRPPAGRALASWRQHAETIAAYRDRWNVTSTTALGPQPAGTAQRIDLARAQAALTRARDLTGDPASDGARRERGASRAL